MSDRITTPTAPRTYTPREVFSPSSLSLARRCERRWAFRYLEGIREPELPYEYFLRPESEAEVRTLPEGPRMLWYNMRSKALGGAVHAVLESYFLKRTGGPRMPRKWRAPDWHTPQGVIARAMASELPHPDECEVIHTESEITIDTKQFCNTVEPITFAGKADLLVKVKGYWTLYDYKSTKSIKNDFEALGYNYVKTPEELRDDEQAALYSLHAMQKAKLDTLDCAWVYGRTKGKAEATSTRFVMGIGRSQTIALRLMTQASHLRAVMRSGARALELEGNPEACEDFGRTCEHHSSNGGLCTVKRSLGKSLIQISIKKKEKSK